jgi:acetyl esterase
MTATAPAEDLLARMFALKPPDSAQDMRALLAGFAGFLNTDLPEVGAFQPGIDVADGVTCDVIAPKGAGPHPVLVYLHGGGWVSGSPLTHRKLGFRFAEAGYLVFHVDYRLAPEHPFPTPLDDCVAAIRFAAREAKRFGGDPRRLAVGGDSAGANLAAAAAIALADDAARPRAALLLYGVFDFASLAAIAGGAAAGPLAEIGTKMIDLMVHSYLGRDPGAALLADPRVSPLRAAHRLPPCHVVVGSADPLVAQAHDLARALAAAGIPLEHHVDEGMPHGYAQMEFLPAARPAIDRMVAFLEAQLG